VSQRIDLVRSSLPGQGQLILEAVEEMADCVVCRVRAKHLRRALVSSIGVQAGPITGNHLNLWMGSKPLGKAIGGSHRKQVDHL